MQSRDLDRKVNQGCGCVKEEAENNTENIPYPHFQHGSHFWLAFQNNTAKGERNTEKDS